MEGVGVVKGVDEVKVEDVVKVDDEEGELGRRRGGRGVRLLREGHGSCTRTRPTAQSWESNSRSTTSGILHGGLPALWPGLANHWHWPGLTNH